jgi:hypothetical protein
MRPEITSIVLAVLAIAFGIVAYLRDPGLPWIGGRSEPFLVALANSGAAIPSRAFPVLAGWLVKVFYQE